jgi:hypothetical protein
MTGRSTSIQLAIATATLSAATIDPCAEEAVRQHAFEAQATAAPAGARGTARRRAPRAPHASGRTVQARRRALVQAAATHGPARRNRRAREQHHVPRRNCGPGEQLTSSRRRGRPASVNIHACSVEDTERGGSAQTSEGGGCVRAHLGHPRVRSRHEGV